MRARTAVDARALRDVHEAFQAQCSRNTQMFRRIDRGAAGAMPASATRMLHASVPRSQAFAIEAAFRGSTAGDRDPLEAPRSEPVTFFHSRRVPGLSLYELGCTLDRTTECGEEALLVTLVLMDRYCAGAKVTPTEHLMHRLYVTCLQIGIKAHCDRYIKNKDFAAAAGVSLAELNCCERIAMDGLKWRAQVTSEQGVCFVREYLAARPPSPVGKASRSALASPLTSDVSSPPTSPPARGVRPLATVPDTARLVHVDPARGVASPDVTFSKLPPPPIVTSSDEVDFSEFCIPGSGNGPSDPETPPNTPVWGPDSTMHFSSFLPSRGMAHLRALFRPLPLGA
uniref:Uncharacterized protein n=1 Tax=Neobodo designis TaxID=312471 RepID=A0A7S1QNY3_NEODS|mmetsp:Transcript_49552/g.152956  ORF Transcript_49552/g.152956 Transcript_49552/m.152956 type:complete len:341 (+) Transcript_49552:134-1156(+)